MAFDFQSRPVGRQRSQGSFRFNYGSRTLFLITSRAGQSDAPERLQRTWRRMGFPICASNGVTIAARSLEFKPKCLLTKRRQPRLALFDAPGEKLPFRRQGSKALSFLKTGERLGRATQFHGESAMDCMVEIVAIQRSAW